MVLQSQLQDKLSFFFYVNNLLHGAQWQSMPIGGIMYGVSIP